MHSNPSRRMSAWSAIKLCVSAGVPACANLRKSALLEKHRRSWSTCSRQRKQWMSMANESESWKVSFLLQLFQDWGKPAQSLRMDGEYIMNDPEKSQQKLPRIGTWQLSSWSFQSNERTRMLETTTQSAFLSKVRLVNSHFNIYNVCSEVVGFLRVWFDLESTEMFIDYCGRMFFCEEWFGWE